MYHIITDGPCFRPPCYNGATSSKLGPLSPDPFEEEAHTRGPIGSVEYSKVQLNIALLWPCIHFRFLNRNRRSVSILGPNTPQHPKALGAQPNSYGTYPRVKPRCCRQLHTESGSRSWVGSLMALTKCANYGGGGSWLRVYSEPPKSWKMGLGRSMLVFLVL